MCYTAEVTNFELPVVRACFNFPVITWELKEPVINSRFFDGLLDECDPLLEEHDY